MAFGEAEEGLRAGGAIRLKDQEFLVFRNRQLRQLAGVEIIRPRKCRHGLVGFRCGSDSDAGGLRRIEWGDLQYRRSDFWRNKGLCGRHRLRNRMNRLGSANLRIH